MKLDVKAMALAGAILWGGGVLLMGVANLVWAGYGGGFLEWLATFYPGYHAARNLGAVIVVTLYALLDGLAGGAIFGWLYNGFVKSSA
ncbi:MAG TPA: hypothetical protein VMA34_15240 [Terracidiphilus sp.]|nr:hypothetical protein [Terracidiphilus sp.]